MANLILPRRFTEQPRGVIALDEQHPLFGNIASAGTVFNGVPFDVKANGLLSRAGTTGIVVRGGQQFATTSTGSGDVWSLSAGKTLLSAQNAVSLFCRAYSSSYNNTRKRAIRFANPTNGTIVALDFGNGSLNYLSASLQTSGGSFPAADAATPLENQAVDVLFTRLGTRMGLYVDGKDALVSTGNLSANNLIGVTNQIFVGNSSSTFPLNGGVAQWVLFSAELSAEWARELYANPWQIFRPRQQILYFDVAAGGIPTLSFPAATSITASSAVPQVTLTF